MEAVRIDYTNYKGERRHRTILPSRIDFRSTYWHPKPQWLLMAFDVDKQVWRSFAIKDIHDWTPVKPAVDAVPAETGDIGARKNERLFQHDPIAI